ncbi:MAG: hypothetical protein GOMPHAMPRED_008188 [Gomphillus americanus]|uniref:Uncharacterized protein n=1 Tax=Gomphillus americanus TaxID=1940652 RepID=A0A8H3II58_9LECA|nr:MAG: hypothetical protein GOMPHAMPRED_008188 [Gomphillus americanus]
MERIRISADAKYFCAAAGGCSLVDPGILMAIADCGNDIVIGDYCDVLTEVSLLILQKTGAAAFAFLKLCAYAGFVTKWQFDQLVAQTIQFRVMSYWKDHALSRRPQGVYGSRMTGLEVHRRINLAMVIPIVSASIATEATMNSKEHMDLAQTCALINDLIDFRGNTWRNQQENVVLRGVRGCLCVYLDVAPVGGAFLVQQILVGRDTISAFLIFCFSNWVLMGLGHKVYKIMLGTQLSSPSLPREYKSKHDGAYEKLLRALEPYGTLGEHGPCVIMRRKDLQMRYSEYRMSSSDHSRLLADVTRTVLHPYTLGRPVDVVRYQWTGDVGDVKHSK